MWYLMNASSLTEHPKVSVTTCAWHWNNCTVYAVRTTGGREMFAVDCGGSEEVGTVHDWTIDTGNGHRRAPFGHEQLTIENVIPIVDGKVQLDKCSNHIGINKPRAVYVFK